MREEQQMVICPMCGSEMRRYFKQLTESGGVVERERKYCQLDGKRFVVIE